MWYNFIKSDNYLWRYSSLEFYAHLAVLCPDHTSHKKQRFGEPSRISCAYYRNVARTNEGYIPLQHCHLPKISVPSKLY